MNAIKQPNNTEALRFVLLLNTDQRDYFEERAAIYQFEGGLACEVSELKAIDAVLKEWPELTAIWPKP